MLKHKQRIIAYKLTISMYQLVKVDFHNKPSDLQERSYGISYILNYKRILVCNHINVV